MKLTRTKVFKDSSSDRLAVEVNSTNVYFDSTDEFNPGEPEGVNYFIFDRDKARKLAKFILKALRETDPEAQNQDARE